jgi:hypothetical protein
MSDKIIRELADRLANLERVADSRTSILLKENEVLREHVNKLSGQIRALSLHTGRPVQTKTLNSPRISNWGSI